MFCERPDAPNFVRDLGRRIISVARALAEALQAHGLPVFARERGFTNSHQFALEAAAFGGGQAAAKKLRQAGFLACGIGLPIAPVEGDLNGLRIGTPELVRIGVTESDVGEIADLFTRALSSNDPASLAPETAALRARFDRLHYIS